MNKENILCNKGILLGLKKQGNIYSNTDKPRGYYK